MYVVNVNGWRWGGGGGAAAAQCVMLHDAIAVMPTRVVVTLKGGGKCGVHLLSGTFV